MRTITEKEAFKLVAKIENKVNTCPIPELLNAFCISTLFQEEWIKYRDSDEVNQKSVEIQIGLWDSSRMLFFSSLLMRTKETTAHVADYATRFVQDVSTVSKDEAMQILHLSKAMARHFFKRSQMDFDFWYNMYKGTAFVFGFPNELEKTLLKKAPSSVALDLSNMSPDELKKFIRQNEKRIEKCKSNQEIDDCLEKINKANKLLRQ